MIKEQVEIAIDDVAQVEQRLRAAGHDDTARLVRKTFEVLLPASIDSAPISPVHHPTVILKLMLDVATEDRLAPSDTRVLLLAIVCHDAFQGAVERFIPLLAPAPSLSGVKVTASAVRTAVANERDQLVRRAVAERTVHNEEAARQASSVLNAASILTGVAIAAEEIETVRSIVGRHDLPSLAQLKSEIGQPVGERDLFRASDWRELLFRCIDRIWMVTPEGVNVDVNRDHARGKATSHREVLWRNAQRHQEEYELYVQVYGDEVGQFNFIEHTLYTSPTAFRLFRQFTEPVA
jgi:hypothetical protein